MTQQQVRQGSPGALFDRTRCFDVLTLTLIAAYTLMAALELFTATKLADRAADRAAALQQLIHIEQHCSSIAAADTY